MSFLELRKISKRFKSGSSFTEVIKRANIGFSENGFYAIIGKSGSGKSTLLNLLSRLLEPDDGEILYQKEDISGFHGKELSWFRLHETATVFQHYNLIENDTALHNAMLPLLIAGVKQVDAIKKAEESFAKFGLTYLKDKNVNVLSGGEKQRVAIIRSLINDPKVVFADEPTGALDEKNSEEIMKLLKVISKDKLVIVVSHNEELVRRYCQDVIEVKNNHVNFQRNSSSKSNHPIERKANTYGRKWVSFFTKRNLKRNMLINSVGFLAGIVGYLSLLFSAGFYVGSNDSLLEQGSRSLEYQMATISERTYVEQRDSALSLVRTGRPLLNTALDIVADIPSVYVKNDYSFFFPNAKAFDLDGVAKEPVSFCPVLDFNLDSIKDLLSSGDIPSSTSLNKVLVNEEFAEANGNNILGKTISFDHDYLLSYEDEEDSGSLIYELEIVGVVSEFSFLNTPKVYYPYLGLESYLYEQDLPNISKAFGYEVSIPRLLEVLDGNHEATSYDYLLFVRNIDQVSSLFSLKEKIDAEGGLISIESSSYEVREAYLSLTSAFSISLVFFVVIAFVGVCLVVGMISYSNFMARRKETAILMALGARENELSEIFSIEAVLVNLTSCLISMGIALLVQPSLNGFIYDNFGLKDFISVPFLKFMDVPFFLPFSLIALACTISYLASRAPLLAIGRMPLADILRDE